MRFLPDREQRAFAASLDAMLSRADTPAVVREWSRGEHAVGRALWARLAGAGVFSLAAGEEAGGVGVRPVELALAFVELGRHAVPGPLVETVTAALLLPDAKLTERLVTGETMATVAHTGTPPADTGAGTGPGTGAGAGPGTRTGAPRTEPGTSGDGPCTGVGTRPGTPGDGTGTADTGPGTPGANPDTEPGTPGANPGTPNTEPRTPRANPDTPGTEPHTGPYALDGDAAGLWLALTPAGLFRCSGHGPVRRSLDLARRLTALEGPEPLPLGPSAARAVPLARLVTAAQALGVGQALLDRTVEHVRRRTQFGVPVGSFQAVKHRLADAEVALAFARPLVLGAALTLAPAEVAAAKAAACEAAYATARTALQLHGAIGYTAECDLSLWLTKARALRTAWGSPEECRAAVLGAGDRRW
ncbi:acyl-CoA dehydrogenase [Streptomyces sp. NPDC000983]|uniref:acyl-CoA dehydrogenase n=1 Tax=Streptomyces sp. NPDC000983 TaxID=3154373 RepID=UPI00331F2C92